MAKTKVITVRRGFLGIGQARRTQRTINRMTRRGWNLTDTTNAWRGTQLIFTRD